MPIILPSIITQHGLLASSSFLSLTNFILISGMTLHHFATRLMPPGCNPTQLLSLGCFITSSIALLRLSLWQTLETIYAKQMNIDRVVEIFEFLLTCKQGDLSLHAHFYCLKALIMDVDIYQPPLTDLVTLKHYHAELYVRIYLIGLRPSIVSQTRGSLLSSDHITSLTTIFSTSLQVMTSTFSPPLSFARGNTPPPSSIFISTLPAHDDGGLPPCFDGSHSPRGHGRNYFPPCP